MTENGKAQIQALGAGLVGFVAVVGAGALLMLPHRSSLKAPAPTHYAAVDVAPLSAPAPVAAKVQAASGAPMGEAGAVASSPAPLLPETERAAPAAEPAPAPAAAAAAPAAGEPENNFARKLVVSQHLDGTSSAHSSARATVAAAAPAKASAPAHQKKFVMPKLDLSKGTQGALASVHYGVSNRSELMGRAAGPVYNFSGAKPSAQNQPAPSASGALSQVDAAAQQIDASSMSDADKAAIKGNLDQVRQAVQTGAPQK